MPSLDILVPFFIATAIFACVPGPGMAYAAAQTMARGARAGWLSAAGMHLAGYAHIAAAAFGMATLLQTVPALYVAVKLAGAAYLVWLGVRLFVGSGSAAGAGESGAATTGTPLRTVRTSLLVELLNPKTALFYLAFLPQFTDLSAALPVWAQILVLGTIVNGMFSLTDAVCIAVSGRIARLWIASRATERLARRAGGGILVALGIGLAASR